MEIIVIIGYQFYFDTPWKIADRWNYSSNFGYDPNNVFP